MDERISLQRLVIAVHDLAGYTRAAQGADPLAIARFMDSYYTMCAQCVGRAGGRVVKFIGDACLAVFPPDRCVEAVDAMTSLRTQVADLARVHGLRVSSGSANLHLAEVAAGEMGPEGDRRFDVLGAGVNHAFLLSARRGPGVHLSEPVYRQLPNDRRAAWRKDRPPAVYSSGE